MKWISIMDGLPKDYQPIIVGRLNEKNVMKIITYRESFAHKDYWGDCIEFFAKPTHWMPLPPPPILYDKKLSEIEKELKEDNMTARTNEDIARGFLSNPKNYARMNELPLSMLVNAYIERGDCKYVDTRENHFNVIKKDLPDGMEEYIHPQDRRHPENRLYEICEIVEQLFRPE